MPFSKEHELEVQPQLPLLARLNRGGKAYGMVAMVRSMYWLRDWYEYIYPSGYGPNASKAYKTRSHLPIR
jgi:hypothetical protein